MGLRSAVGAPIIVERQLWGGLIVGTTVDEPLPPDTEDRLAKFAELVAAAISNAEARQELTASRARIAASADETRRRIVRDLHDAAGATGRRLARLPGGDLSDPGAGRARRR